MLVARFNTGLKPGANERGGKRAGREVGSFVSVEHLPNFSYVAGARGFVERDADGPVVNHAKVHSMRFREFDDVRCTLLAEIDAQGVKVGQASSLPGQAGSLSYFIIELLQPAGEHAR